MTKILENLHVVNIHNKYLNLLLLFINFKNLDIG